MKFSSVAKFFLRSRISDRVKKIDQENNGIVRSISELPPTHYSLEIQLFSQLKLNCCSDRYESKEFKAGGYKWKLVFYPKGNIKKNVNNHISFYLVIVGVADDPLDSTWEVNVDFSLFLLDQNKSHYLVFQNASTKKICMHEEMRSVGFDKLITLKEFTDVSNGFLVDDRCVFGAEVFVCKERRKVKRESLEKMEFITACKHVCIFEDFSSLEGKTYQSQPFYTGKYKWIIILFSTGNFNSKGNHISAYLKYVDGPSLPTGSNILVDFKLGLLDKSHPICFPHWREGQLFFGHDIMGWGWPTFMSEELLRQNYLVKDACSMEVEVIVRGISKALN